MLATCVYFGRVQNRLCRLQRKPWEALLLIVRSEQRKVLQRVDEKGVGGELNFVGRQTEPAPPRHERVHSVKRFNDCGYRYRIEIGVGLRRVTQENEFGRDKGADTMELLDELQQADVVLKLEQRQQGSSHFTRVDPLRAWCQVSSASFWWWRRGCRRTTGRMAAASRRWKCC